MKISQPYFIKWDSRYWKYFLSIILKRSVFLSFISDICVKRICDKPFSADPGSFVVMTRLVYLIRNQR